jgi:hypothetical protein
VVVIIGGTVDTIALGEERVEALNETDMFVE